MAPKKSIRSMENDLKRAALGIAGLFLAALAKEAAKKLTNKKIDDYQAKRRQYRDYEDAEIVD